MTDCWDDDFAPPPRISKMDSGFNSNESAGFAMGRGRGFGNMRTLRDTLPSFGNANQSYANDDNGWVEDTNQHTSNDSGWNETNDSSSYQSSSYQNNNSSRGYQWDNNNRSGGSGCRKCGEEGHFARECPNDSGDRRGGGGGRGGGCFKCNQEGHMARDCPNSDSSSYRPPRTCNKCGEEGHMARDCNNDSGGGGSRGRGCFKCGEEGHISRDCPSADSGGGGGSRGKGCFKCGEEGHMSRDCPNGDSSGGGSRGKGCFNCGEEGHMSRDCTNPEKPKLGPDGKPRAPIYIPPEPSVDADQLFNSVPAGINFSKYEAIPVDVTGSGAPPPIQSFEGGKLNKHLLSNIKRSKYDVPTPIQKYAIPIVMQKRDLMACAQTGSGKTAAFLLPIIHDLLTDSNLPNAIDKDVQQPLALVLSPTRELAIQIMSEANKFAFDSIVRAEVVYGGTSTYYQASRLKRGVHILVATPGRLMDFVEKGKVSFEKLKYFVLDEADRMLDMGFMPTVEKMVALMPPKGERQTLMFSATFPEEIQRLAGNFLDDYLFLTVGTVGGANTDVEQTFFKLGSFDKKQKLLDILETTGTNRVLVFVEQKRNADFLASFLSQKQLPTTSIHGDRLQKEREDALRDFRNGHMPILVATAVAARGLDIKDVEHVVNFDLPQSIDEYVHRIGRTGRVGNIGKATSFYDPESDQPLARSLKKILIDAQQVIPDWLHEEAANAVGASANYSRGSRDIRNTGRSRNQSTNDGWDDNFAQNDNTGFSEPVVAEESWD